MVGEWEEVREREREREMAWSSKGTQQEGGWVALELTFVVLFCIFFSWRIRRWYEANHRSYLLVFSVAFEELRAKTKEQLGERTNEIALFPLFLVLSLRIEM